MRIAFFGLPLAALLLQADGHEIVLAAICRAGAPGLRRLQTKHPGSKLTCLMPDAENEGFARWVRDVRPELIVSWFWTKRLPAAILAIAPAIGVHPSLLPRHRGPDPFFWAIRSGDEVTGATAHVLDEAYDTGPILGRRTLRIDPTWNAWSLARKLDRPSLALLREVVSAYARGEPPAGEPQDDRLATTAPDPDDDTLAIRWRDPAADILRLIRAASPWPGAFTEMAGEMVAVTRAAITADFPRALEPGEAWVRPDGAVVVRAGEGALELHEGRIDLDPGMDGTRERFLDRRGLGELLGGRHPVA